MAATNGRHRRSPGALRLVRDNAGDWALTSVNHATHSVGRVGTLAVALVVGGVIFGLPATAAADDGGVDARGSADGSAATTSTAASP